MAQSNLYQPINWYLHLIPFDATGSLALLFASVGEVLVLAVVETDIGTARVNTGRAFFSGGVVICVELESNRAHIVKCNKMHNFRVVIVLLPNVYYSRVF